MTFGPTPTITQSLGMNEFPLSEVYTPEDGINLVQGGPSSTDALNSKKSAPVSTYVKDGNNVTQGTSTDANTANTVMGRLTKIRDLLNGTLLISGAITEANSAAILADLATLAGAISTGRMLITPPANTNVTEANSTAILADLATLAGAVSSSKMATKAGVNDIVDLASLLTKFNAALDGSGYVYTHQKLGGSDISTTNPMPVNTVAQAGEVALYASNPTALTANTDAAVKWGASGTTAVNHIEIYNGWTGSINVRLDAATTAGSAVIASGQTKTYDVAGTLACHLQANGTPSVNGSSSGNIVVTGWL